MFSKFDTNIQSDELAPVEPTQADWEEYHAWLEEQEAAEPELELSFDPHRDFYAEWRMKIRASTHRSRGTTIIPITIRWICTPPNGKTMR